MADRNTIEVLEFGQRTYAFDDVELEQQLPMLSEDSVLCKINYKVAGERICAL